MSTFAMSCNVVRSHDFYPCKLVLHCPFSLCQSPQIWWSRDVRSGNFSCPPYFHAIWVWVLTAVAV